MKQSKKPNQKPTNKTKNSKDIKTKLKTESLQITSVPVLVMKSIKYKI